MANIDPKDAPFLLSEETGIDWNMLRDKFTGRSLLFFNNDNFGGRRGSRVNNGWDIPDLTLDPSVKYRVFRGDEFAQDILTSNRISGGYNVGSGLPAGVFFNQGVPLWSYASTPGERYMVATLGDTWGDRHGNGPEKTPALPTDWKEGGTELKDRLGDFGEDAVKTQSVSIPPHEGGVDTQQKLAVFKHNLDDVIRKHRGAFGLAQSYEQWQTGKREGSEGKEFDWSNDDFNQLENYIKKNNPRLWIQMDLENDDAIRQIKELQEKIEVSFKSGGDPVSSSYDRSDWRREISGLENQIVHTKLAAYVPEFNKTFSDNRRREMKALITPEVQDLILKHVKWLDETSKFIAKESKGGNLSVAQKNLLTRPELDWTNVIGAHNHAIGSLDNMFPSIDYIHADSGLVGGSRLAAMTSILGELMQPENAKSPIAKEYPAAFAEHVLLNLPDILYGFSSSSVTKPIPGQGVMTTYSHFPNYTINNKPTYLPLYGKTDTEAAKKSLEKESFFESPTGRRYLVGPNDEKIYIGSSDDISFATPGMAWDVKARFGNEPVRSDGNNIGVSQLQWSHIGKEGAMYSESLPLARWTAPWSTTTVNKHNEWEFYNLSDEDLGRDLSTLQSLGVNHDSFTSRRLAHLGKGHAVEYQTADGFSPSEGSPAVMLPNGDVIKKIYHPQMTVGQYAGSSDPGLVRLLRTIPPDKLNEPIWVRLKGGVQKTNTIPRQFQFPAGEVDLSASARPAVLIKIDPSAPSGYTIIKEWNNDPNNSGVKPIPTHPSNMEQKRNALIRFAQESIEPMAKDTLEDMRKRSYEELSYLDEKERATRADEEAKAEFARLRAKFPWLDSYTGPEDWADRVIGGEKFDFNSILWRTSSSSRTPPPELAAAETKGYTTIQNLIDESTRGNPNYGKLGSNFGPQLEAMYDFGKGMDDAVSRNTRQFANRYLKDSAFRGNVNNATLGALERHGPTILMSAAAGMHLRSKVDEGMPLYQAIPATGAEMGLGYLTFKYFDRYLGGVTTMGDATIEGWNRRKAEEDAIRDESPLRPDRISRNTIDLNKKVDWNIVDKTEKNRQNNVKEKERIEAVERWNKENPLWVDGELNKNVI